MALPSILLTFGMRSQCLYPCLLCDRPGQPRSSSGQRDRASVRPDALSAWYDRTDVSPLDLLQKSETLLNYLRRSVFICLTSAVSVSIKDLCNSGLILISLLVGFQN